LRSTLGHKPALRIPHAIAAETVIEQGSEVEISLADGRLVVTPVPEQKFSLEALLAEVTADNLHSQVDTGSAEGVEVW
jgi:antitoxin MazE